MSINSSDRFDWASKTSQRGIHTWITTGRWKVQLTDEIIQDCDTARGKKIQITEQKDKSKSSRKVQSDSRENLLSMLVRTHRNAENNGSFMLQVKLELRWPDVVIKGLFETQAWASVACCVVGVQTYRSRPYSEDCEEMEGRSGWMKEAKELDIF